MEGDLIDHLKPYVVCLEMVPTALKVNQGWEVKTVLESLSREYKVTSEVIQCWRYGDVSTSLREDHDHRTPKGHIH